MRHKLELPFGEPQFEYFRAAYLTPGGKQWLEAVYERSRPYASYIMERIQYFGVPEEIFFLPFIESEYSAKALSRSEASGLWQFMRNSVGGYDMRMDDWLDERRDFMKSTDGALRKLKSNYDRFGDWLLALGAYNCGAGAMDRAIKAGKSHDYWVLREGGFLPKETASYTLPLQLSPSPARWPQRPQRIVDTVNRLGSSSRRQTNRHSHACLQVRRALRYHEAGQPRTPLRHNPSGGSLFPQGTHNL
ncbi:hypothetical protein MASR2M48_34370 [Spirochaetota bacterium]